MGVEVLDELVDAFLVRGNVVDADVIAIFC